MATEPGTVALPGENGIRIAQDIRIAVGQKKPDEKAPRKLDHFLLTRYNPQVKQYTVDTEAMQVLAKHLGAKADDCKPKRIPIQVLANLERVPDPVTGEPRLEVPESILFRRMAYYWGSRRQCASEKFRVKDEDECKEDELSYPPDPNSIAAWIGRARQRRYDEHKRVTGERIKRCNPMRCPLATGQHEVKGYEGKPLCKPQTIFSCILPFMPRLGTAAKFVTTSWQSTALLRSSLLEIGGLVKEPLRGWLVLLPLELVMSIETVSADGWTAPVVHVEFSGDALALNAEAERIAREYAGFEKRMAELTGGNLKALDAGEEAEAFASEFAHESAQEAPDTAPALEDWGTDGALQELAQEAGWTDAILKLALSDHDGDTDAVIALLEADLGYVQDADFEDPEAEHESSEYEDDTPPSEEDPFADPPDFENGGQASMEVE